MWLFVVNTEYESPGRRHLWGQIIRAAGSNELLQFFKQSDNYRLQKRVFILQQYSVGETKVAPGCTHTAQCNSRRGEKKWKYSRISRPLHSRLLDFKSVNLQLGMLISSEMLIHHGRAHESTLTNDQMRPYFNLLLIPFQLLSSPVHISSFSITIRSQCNNHRLARTSSPCRGLKNKRFMSDPWKISNGESVCFHFL